MKYFRGFLPALVSGYIIHRQSWQLTDYMRHYESIIFHMNVAARMMDRGVVMDLSESIQYRTSESDVYSQNGLFPFQFHLDMLSAARGLPKAFHNSAARGLVHHAVLWMLSKLLVKDTTTTRAVRMEIVRRTDRISCWIVLAYLLLLCPRKEQ